MKSQECKSFEMNAVTIKNSMTELSSFKKQSGLPFILKNTADYGLNLNEYGNSGHLSIFTLLKHLINDAFEVQIFQGFTLTAKV